MTFNGSYSGMGELLRGPETEAMLLGIMAEKQAVAEAIAPERTGRYKSAFVVRPGFKPDRACAVLENLVDYAMDVEFGAKDTPRYRTLGRALGIAEGV